MAQPDGRMRAQRGSWLSRELTAAIGRRLSLESADGELAPEGEFDKQLFLFMLFAFGRS